MTRRMDFWEWMDLCPMDFQIVDDGGVDITLTFFFEEQEELEIVFIPDEELEDKATLENLTGIKLVVDNDTE